MKVISIPKMCCNLGKLWHLHHLQKTYHCRIHWRSFHPTSNFYQEKNENVNSALSVKGMEQIETLKLVSKKNNKLSVVEEKDIEVVEKLKAGNIFYPYKGPMDRFKNVLLEDAKVTFRKIFKLATNVTLEKLEVDYFYRHTDILIVGGGVVGLLIAFAIRSNFPHGPEVTVVDKNSDFPHSSTNLGMSMITPQLFNTEEEIPLIQYGAEFFSSFSRQTGVFGHPRLKLHYDPLGSLILADVKNAETLLKNNEILKMHGIHNKILSISALKKKFPWLNLDNVLFGSLGCCNEGIIDPWTFLNGIKCKCINCGVNFVTAEIVDFGFEDDMAVRAICKLPNGSYNSIDFSYCVIAGGIESLHLVELFNNLNFFNLGLKLPLEERMRFEYCFYSPDGPGLNTPIVLDSEGTYFRREGLTGHFIAGMPSVVNYDNGKNGPYQVFEEKIKPFLAKILPQMNEVHLTKGWIDAYDFCFSNQVGITGPHPETSKFVFALGFSHFGLSLLPALARGTMEYIFYDDYQTIDFTPFHIENLWKKQHLEADRKRRELLESQQRVAITDGDEKKELRES